MKRARGLARVLREPLIHFLLIGGLLFAVFEVFNPSSEADSGGTFTHIFFDAEVRGSDQARDAAREALVRVNERKVPSSDASRWGDRPLFFQNYVERTRDFVVSYLGEDLAAGLDDVALHPESMDSGWRRPFESPYGWHLVLPRERRPARLPDLAEIEQRVAEDYLRIQIDQARRRSIAQLVDEYEVDIVGLDLGTDIDSETVEN